MNRPGDKIDPIEFPTMAENTDSSGGFLISLFGWFFHGCWHDYTSWGKLQRFRQGSCQKRECRKCGRVSTRVIFGPPGPGGGSKPEKPDSPPTVSKTPKPPTGGTGESS